MKREANMGVFTTKSTLYALKENRKSRKMLNSIMEKDLVNL
jgi:hypothetical protein